jgi:hypothetical protein
MKFIESGDAARSSAVLLPELVEAGLRVLIYAGEAGVSSFAMSLTHTYIVLFAQTCFVRAW